MPQGDKDSYTDKQKRKAAHIEAGYEASGAPRDEAKARAWATVNKQDGGGNKSGSGRGQPVPRTAAERSDSAKKAAATRKRNAAAK